MAEHARSARVQLLYEGVDISEDISEHLVNFTFTDNEGGKADDLSVTLEDKDGRWRGDWLPSKGATLTATIITEDWDSPGQSVSYPCGTFEIDQLDVQGPPSTVSIKATSTRMSQSIRQESHTKTWENSQLSTIAKDIADANNLTLLWDSSEDPQLARKDQVEKSDISFLSELCEEHGIEVKVTDDQLVCYSVADYEAKDAVGVIKYEDVASYRFSTKSDDVYQKAHVSYHDPVKNETQDAEVESEDIEGEDGEGDYWE